MAARDEKSPLLALPLELRILVYEHLLSSHPNRVHALYHDRYGKQGSFDIHPTILRVNKQIYSEAVAILYDTIHVRIYLGTPVGFYPEGIVEPPELFRTDDEEDIKSMHELDWQTVPSTGKNLKSHEQTQPDESLKSQEWLEGAAPGYIYPHCLKRLRGIQLVTSRPALWGVGQCGHYLSHTGQIVLQILRLLAEEQVPKSTGAKHIKVTFQPDWDPAEAPRLLRDRKLGKLKQAVVRLLKTLQSRTDAKIEIEDVFLRSSNEQDADVEDWEMYLLAAYW